MRALIFLAVCAGMAAAQEPLEGLYGPLLLQCYEEADGSEAKFGCIGATSATCIEEEDGGYSTLGMSMCTMAETEVWDQLLNSEYRQTMNFMKILDADDLEIFPEFANRAAALRDAQRAWITFRDTECGLRYAIWGAGSMRHIAGSACLADMTARRTIDLRDMRELMQ